MPDRVANDSAERGPIPTSSTLRHDLDGHTRVTFEGRSQFESMTIKTQTHLSEIREAKRSKANCDTSKHIKELSWVQALFLIFLTLVRVPIKKLFA